MWEDFQMNQTITSPWLTAAAHRCIFAGTSHLFSSVIYACFCPPNTPHKYVLFFLPTAIQNPQVYNVKVHKTTTKWPFTSGSTANCEGWIYKKKKKAIKCGNGPEGWCDTEGGGGMGNEMKLLCPPFNSVVANSISIMQRFCFDIGRIRHE